MQWKDVGKVVGKFAPLLGNLLPIPGAGIAGQLISAALGTENTPDAIHAAIKADPEAAIKLAKIEADNRVELQNQLLLAESSRIKAVNKTMQAEAASEHWAQWMWRPYNGFLFGTTLFFVYALPSIINTFAPMIYKPIPITSIINGAERTIMTAQWIPINISPVPEFVFVAWGAVLGVSAWHRGAGKVAKITNSKSN